MVSDGVVWIRALQVVPDDAESAAEQALHLFAAGDLAAQTVSGAEKQL